MRSGLTYVSTAQARPFRKYLRKRCDVAAITASSDEIPTMPAIHAALPGGGSSIPGRYFFFVHRGDRDTTTPRFLMSNNVASRRHVPSRQKLAARGALSPHLRVALASPAPDTRSSSSR
jgi:hypothetical protein